MGEYAPDDSRDVTLNPGNEPGGIERTGPREGETREQQTRKDDSWRSGEQAGGSAKGKRPEYAATAVATLTKLSSASE